jgi:Transposase IS66 family
MTREIRGEELAAVSPQELMGLVTWVKEAESVPTDIRSGFKRVLAVYSNLSQGPARAKRTLTALRLAMGIIPKSERGKSLNPGAAAAPVAAQVCTEGWDAERLKAFEVIQTKRKELSRQKSDYDRMLKNLGHRPAKGEPEQMSFELARPNEMLFSFPVGLREETIKEPKVERMKEFGKTVGLHAAHDRPKRVNVQIIVTEIQYKVETVTDPETGKSVRASMVDEGPEGCLYTWGAIANLMKLHVGFAIPIHRLSLIIGQPEFTPSNIYRALRRTALSLLPIYLYLAEELSDAQILSGDDTVTKVLERTEAAAPDALSRQIDEELTFAHPYANGKGIKQSLNVSLLIGKPKPDPRSTIRFFRTHVGSVGNLLNTILTWRKPQSGSVIFQGDLSNTNLPTPEMRERFKLALAGCGAHARRPFWRYREQDESLCYFMLRGFLLLSRVEKTIDARGRTHERVLKLRGRYGRWIWHALRNRCIAATTGVVPSPGTYPRGIQPNVWPKGSELNAASVYVINHFESLTLYLDHPALEYTNNGSERGVRIEKCMLSSSKFRKTRDGRAVLDVLRTINSTCTAAGIDPEAYLRYVYKHEADVHDHPERFTPYAVARILESKPQADVVAPTMPLS